MSINQLPDNFWTALINGSVSIQCEFLALSLLITNLKSRQRAQNMSDAEVAAEFKKFFAKYSQLPVLQRDITKIAQLRGYHV